MKKGYMFIKVKAREALINRDNPKKTEALIREIIQICDRLQWDSLPEESPQTSACESEWEDGWCKTSQS